MGWGEHAGRTALIYIQCPDIGLRGLDTTMSQVLLNSLQAYLIHTIFRHQHKTDDGESTNPAQIFNSAYTIQA